MFFELLTSKIENVIKSQKFAGAAADLLNANIIARDLGLKDASSTEHTGELAFTKIERVIIDPDGKNSKD